MWKGKQASRALMIAILSTLGADKHSESTLPCLKLDILHEEAIEASSDRLIVIEHGKILLDQRSPQGSQSLSLQSISKSLLALAFGLLSIKDFDESDSAIFPEWKNDYRNQITARDLLTQRSGLCEKASTSFEMERSEDCIKYGIKTRLCKTPGIHFQYSNNGPNLLGRYIEKVTGKKIDIMLENGLFAPLDVKTARWAKDPKGNIYAMGGLSMTADDLAVVGQVMLANGVWKNRQLISKSWLDQLKKAETRLFFAPATHYSRLWYVLTDSAETKLDPALMAYGWRGQYLIIVPHLDRVIVRLRDPYRRINAANYEMSDLPQKALLPLCKETKHAHASAGL